MKGQQIHFRLDKRDHQTPLVQALTEIGTGEVVGSLKSGSSIWAHQVAIDLAHSKKLLAASRKTGSRGTTIFHSHAADRLGAEHEGDKRFTWIVLIGEIKMK